MNKAIFILAILAFSLAPTTLSSPVKGSEDKDRELISINLGNLLGGLFGGTKNTTNTTAPVANNTTPVANTTTPVANNTTPVANTTTPVANNTTPVTNTTAPVANTTTPVANNTTPVTNTTTPVANNTTPETNTTTPVANNTTPETNTTTPVTPPAPIKYAKNDVNMATFPEDCLKVHNQERMEVGLGNLTWSTDLAKSAQAWAENMASNGFRHSGKSGENIASSSYSTYTLARLLGLWTKEQNYFIVGCKYPKCSSTSAEVGHYTQMVWHSTTQVGCGFAPGANRGYNYLCCQYYKAGNIVGQYVY